MNSKKKKIELKLSRTLSVSLAAAMLAGPMVSAATPVWAKEGKNVAISAAAEVDGITPKNYPDNLVQELNWDKDEMSENDVNYWGISQANPKQKLVRVTTSDPIEIVDFTYEGTFVDEEGRTNLRLSYMEKSAAVSAVWKQALFRFDDDLIQERLVDTENQRIYAFALEKSVLD